MEIPKNNETLVGIAFEIKKRIDELEEHRKMLVAEIQRRGISGSCGPFLVKSQDRTTWTYDQERIGLAVKEDPRFAEFFKSEWKADNRKINDNMKKNPAFAAAFDEQIGREEKKTVYTTIESTMEE